MIENQFLLRTNDRTSQIQLQEEYHKSKVVHGGTPKKDRDRIIEEFRKPTDTSYRTSKCTKKMDLIIQN